MVWRVDRSRESTVGRGRDAAYLVYVFFPLIPGEGAVVAMECTEGIGIIGYELVTTVCHGVALASGDTFAELDVP